MKPWKGFLATVIGAAFVSATAQAQTLPPPAIVTPLPVYVNPTTKVVTISVRVSGGNDPLGGFVPMGSVIFTESNNTLGTVRFPVNCASATESCDYRLRLPGYSMGPHTITAYYTGDGGARSPTSVTFMVVVSDLSWLSSVLSLLD